MTESSATGKSRILTSEQLLEAISDKGWGLAKKVREPVSVENATFSEGLSFEKTVFEGDVVLQDVYIAGDFSLRGTTINGRLSLVNVEIEKDLLLEQAALKGPFLPYRTTVHGEVLCGENLGLWLTCVGIFNPQGTPVHADHRQVEFFERSVKGFLEKIPRIFRP